MDGQIVLLLPRKCIGSHELATESWQTSMARVKVWELAGIHSVPSETVVVDWPNRECMAYHALLAMFHSFLHWRCQLPSFNKRPHRCHCGILDTTEHMRNEGPVHADASCMTSEICVEHRCREQEYATQFPSRAQEYANDCFRTQEVTGIAVVTDSRLTRPFTRRNPRSATCQLCPCWHQQVISRPTAHSPQPQATPNGHDRASQMAGPTP